MLWTVQRIVETDPRVVGQAVPDIAHVALAQSRIRRPAHLSDPTSAFTHSRSACQAQPDLRELRDLLEQRGHEHWVGGV